MKKKLVWMTVTLALAAAGFWWGRPLYRNWKQERLMKVAREAMQKGDLRKASLSAGQAYRVNPKSIEPCQMLADITESLRLPAALDWRRRVADLSPGVLSNRLNWARTGILLGDYPQAAQALRGVDKTNQNTVAFHQMAAMVAVSLNNIAAADRHFAEAIRLDPTNKLLELNEAIIHLQARDKNIVAGALKSLEQLYHDPTYRKDALRHLAMAATRNKDYAKAAAFTQELQADPEATLSDRLLHLTVLKESGNAEFAGYLTQLETACATKGESANMLTSWLLGHDMTSEAERWLATLPAKFQSEPPVVLARADCFMALGNWAALEALLKDAKLDGFDFLRQAMLARAYHEQQQQFAAQTAWRSAVREVSDNPKKLGVLAHMANRWGWEDEKEAVLWVLVERFPAERWAMQSLGKSYLESGNTRGLHRLYSKMLERDPADFGAMNNLAAVSLLLNLQTNRAIELARDAYLKASNNAAFVSTYAWSLHLQGRTAEGIKLLENLKPEQLETPSVALYYGVMELAMKQPEKARKYLDLASRGNLLPEEKTLLDDARSEL